MVGQAARCADSCVRVPEAEIDGLGTKATGSEYYILLQSLFSDLQ